MALKVIKIVRVNPATNSSDDSVNSVNLPLSFFDLRWIKFHANKRVIFYKLTESSPESFHSIILPKLELSLSLVLRHYLPLAGRLTWDPQDPKPCITVSNHDTVSLTVAETNADFSLVSGNGHICPATELHLLVPNLTVCDDSTTVLSLQITLFPNQGFCIGIAYHQSVLDGKTSTMFIKSWAHISRLQEHKKDVEDFPLLPDDLTPSFDRKVINVPRGLEEKMMGLVLYLSKDSDNFRTVKPPPLGEISADVVRVTLELTAENIEKLREKVKNDPSRSQLHLSTFVIAYAYSWTCVVKARGGNPNRPVNFLYLADFRHRLDPKVPATYSGSCVFPIGYVGSITKQGHFWEKTVL